jgi:hypothetical protein
MPLLRNILHYWQAFGDDLSGSFAGRWRGHANDLPHCSWDVETEYEVNNMYVALLPPRVPRRSQTLDECCYMCGSDVANELEENETFYRTPRFSHGYLKSNMVQVIVWMPWPMLESDFIIDSTVVELPCRSRTSQVFCSEIILVYTVAPLPPCGLQSYTRSRCS